MLTLAAKAVFVCASYKSKSPMWPFRQSDLVLVEMSRLLSLVSKFAVYVQAKRAPQAFVCFAMICSDFASPPVPGGSATFPATLQPTPGAPL